MIAPMVELVWQSSDRVVTSTSAITLAPATRSPAHSSATHHSVTGLSTDEKVAIGVTIPVAILAAAIVIFVLYRRRVRRRQQAAHPSYSPNRQPSWPMAPGNENTAFAAKYTPELEVVNRAQELESDRVFEVEGSSPEDRRRRS